MSQNHSFDEQSLQIHKKLKGKIKVVSRAAIRDTHDLSLFYTPGVGAVSSYLAAHKSEMKHYTIKNDLVAIISDGSAVLGLGNIGFEGALPVMEGKAMLFRELADMDAFPIVLDTQDEAQIIETIVNIAPVFGGINLEDIAAPKCFAIERALQQRLSIPVVHDDQHATAIAVLAGLINALKVVGKKRADVSVVISGAGAAGNGVCRLIHAWGVADIIVLDSKGILSRDRSDLDEGKIGLLQITNKADLSGDLTAAMTGADIFIGLSQPNILSAAHVASMSKDAIVFAMANPNPEIMPDIAQGAGAAVVATGRSDFPNQINNVLVFPGMFKGLIASGAGNVTDEMKLAASKALAEVVDFPTAELIIPSVFDKRVVPAIVGAIGDSQ